MKRPKNWTIMLNHNTISTDMLDGCLLQLMQTRKIILGRLYNDEHAKRHTKARERRIIANNIKLSRITDRYRYLLSRLKPITIVSYQARPSTDKYYYAIYTLGTNKYFLALSETDAQMLANLTKLDITYTRYINFPKCTFENLPSLATVNEVIATIATRRISNMIDTGNFNMSRYTDTEPPIEIDETICNSMLEFGKRYACVYHGELNED